MKKTILLLVSLCTLGVNAQDFSFGADVQSRYVWRGIQFGGEDMSLQPGVEYAAGNFAVGAWAAYSLGGDNPDQYDSSGNKGEGGLAGEETSGNVYLAIGSSMVYDLGVGGAGGDSSFDGADGLSGLVVITSNGSEVVRTSTDGTYTVV